MKDPVCGMEISEHSSKNCTDYQGQHLCFCSKGCMETFQENPQQFVGQKGGSSGQQSQKKSQKA